MKRIGIHDKDPPTMNLLPGNYRHRPLNADKYLQGMVAMIRRSRYRPFEDYIPIADMEP
jgi:hypothetical protein